MSTPEDPAVPLAERLATVLGGPVEVAELTRLTGGASRETWSFVATARGGAPRRLVLRRDPLDEAGAPVPSGGAGMAVEAAAIAAAARAGVAVPRLVDSSGDPAVLGTPYLITEHVDGEVIPRRLLRDPAFARARAGLAAELGRTLARVHAIPVDAVPGLPAEDPLAGLRGTYDSLGEPLPVVEVALAWLTAHRPAAVPATVVHGDFRTGNLIVDPGGLRAVLDWELVHLGDPRQDLGWLCVKCWRFGSPLPAGGFGTVDQLLDGYAEVVGERPDPAAVRWWQVYGTAWWAVGCRLMAERHLSGATSSVELAAVGRRVCEQEHDLLRALGVPDDPAAPPSPAPPSDLHGRPTAPELVAAVADFLRTEVMPATDDRLSFLTRVAANALAVVERELLLGPAQERRHRDRLAALARSNQEDLAAAIRAGVLDPTDPALLAALRAAVTDRLTVANPRYLTHPD